MCVNQSNFTHDFILPRNDELNNKAQEVNSFLKSMCKNIGIDFVDNSRFIDPRKHLDNSKLFLNLKVLAKLQYVLTESMKSLLRICFPVDIAKHFCQILQNLKRVNYRDRQGFVSRNLNTSKPFKKVLVHYLGLT